MLCKPARKLSKNREQPKFLFCSDYEVLFECKILSFIFITLLLQRILAYRVHQSSAFVAMNMKVSNLEQLLVRILLFLFGSFLSSFEAGFRLHFLVQKLRGSTDFLLIDCDLAFHPC